MFRSRGHVLGQTSEVPEKPPLGPGRADFRNPATNQKALLARKKYRLRIRARNAFIGEMPDFANRADAARPGVRSLFASLPISAF